MPPPPPPPPGPPPPPAGPPPPPIGGLKLGGVSKGGDPRNALLQSIQMGAKLKKVQTVDKSGPAIAGRVTGSSAPAKASNNTNYGGSSGASATANGGSPAAPKLGGIFGGMSAMPKLKPVGAGKGGMYPIKQTNMNIEFEYIYVISRS